MERERASPDGGGGALLSLRSLLLLPGPFLRRPAKAVQHPNPRGAEEGCRSVLWGDQLLLPRVNQESAVSPAWHAVTGSIHEPGAVAGGSQVGVLGGGLVGRQES